MAADLKFGFIIAVSPSFHGPSRFLIPFLMPVGHFHPPFPCWFVRSSLKDKGTKEQVSKEGAWNRNIILVKKESCLSVCLYLHLKRMKLCGIFIAYQRLCVFYFGACTHQQPMSTEGGHLLHSVKKGPYTRKIFLLALSFLQGTKNTIWRF